MPSASEKRQPDLWSKVIAVANSIQLTYWLVIIGGFIARTLPLRLTYGIATLLGDLVFYTWRDKRDVTVANIRRLLGPEADEGRVWCTARETYRNYLKYVVDFLRFPSLTPEEVKQAVDSDGWEHLDRALSQGKGVILVGMHFGNWDLAAAVVALRGYPVHVVVDTFDPPKLNGIIQKHRREKGVNVIHLDDAARGVLRVLKRGEVLGLLVDKPVPGQGVKVHFCGAPIEVPAGAAMLARRTGAAIMPGFVLRGPNNKFFGHIRPHIEVPHTDDIAKDIAVLTQRIMDTLEEVARQHPEQCYLFRRLWEQPSPQAALVN